MATTSQDLKQSDEDFASSFNEDMPNKAEPSEDEAFGIMPEASAEAPAVEVTDDAAASGEPAGQTAMESEGDMVDDDDAPRDGGEADGGVPTEMAAPGKAYVEANEAVEAQPQTTGADGAPKAGMTEQQLKSWEGRLKKAQAEIDAKSAGAAETPAAEALEQASDQAEDTNPVMAEAIEDVAEKVEGGELTMEAASKQLSEDFGEDFVKLIETIAKHYASMAGSSAAEAKVGEVGKAVTDIITHISDASAKAHFKEIEAAHPDFADIGQSEGFRQYIDSMGGAEKEDATRVASSGSASEINKLLSMYKNSQQGEPTEDAEKPAADPVVDQQMDAAEGVRSSGMALPEAPAKASDGYEDAWKEFA